jgi:TolB-like protein
MATDPPVQYEFGGFRLDGRRRQLFSADAGEPVPLTPKVFETLLYFVEHRGELLDKATLLRALWPGLTVEENNLNQNISTLRKALGEAPREHRFIVTVPGRGYRFVADVKTPFVEAIPRQQRASSAASTLNNGAPRTSVAVLPFANLTGDPAKEYLSDGMAEELICTLSRTRGLKVPARTSSFGYKNRNIDIRQIARELNVETVLEGSIRGAGERIRVTAQLVDAATGFHLWSQNYDRKFEDLFALQDELAAAMAQALRVHVGPTDHPTEDLEAYQLFMRGRSRWARLSAPNTARAIELFGLSLARDPNFARAHSGKAAAQYLSALLGHATAELLSEAQEAAERAIALDPTLAEPHAVLGGLHAFGARWLKAEICFEAATALDETDGTTQLLRALVLDGASGQIRRAMDRARDVYLRAPSMLQAAVAVSGFYSIRALSAEAVAYARIAVDLGYPEDQFPLPVFRSEAARRAGRFAEARDEILTFVPQEIRAAGGEQIVGLIFAAMEDPMRRSEAVAALSFLNAHPDLAILEEYPVSMLSLHCFSMLGALDQAYAVAERWLDAFERTGIVSVVNLASLWIPELREFRCDPRFQRFVSKLGLIDYWKHSGPPDGCDLRCGVLDCA